MKRRKETETQLYAKEKPPPERSVSEPPSPVYEVSLVLVLTRACDID